jgi:hypothetical protein
MLEFNIGGRPTRTQYQYTLQDANLDELNQWSSKIFDKLKTIPELRDVATGSSFDRAAFVALIGKGRATMAFTDPSYNVPIHGHVWHRCACPRQHLSADGFCDRRRYQ